MWFCSTSLFNFYNILILICRVENCHCQFRYTIYSRFIFTWNRTVLQNLGGDVPFGPFSNNINISNYFIQRPYSIRRIGYFCWLSRGLPHCHMLIWVADEYVPKTPEERDMTISAEITDKETHPRLHKLVMSQMIHGPCSKDINKNVSIQGVWTLNIRTKSFPKELTAETVIRTNGYPI